MINQIKYVFCPNPVNLTLLPNLIYLEQTIFEILVLKYYVFILFIYILYYIISPFSLPGIWILKIKIIFKQPTPPFLSSLAILFTTPSPSISNDVIYRRILIGMQKVKHAYAHSSLSLHFRIATILVSSQSNGHTAEYGLYW